MNRLLRWIYWLFWAQLMPVSVTRALMVHAGVPTDDDRKKMTRQQARYYNKGNYR